MKSQQSRKKWLSEMTKNQDVAVRKKDVDPYLKFACVSTGELNDNIRSFFKEPEFTFAGWTKPEVCQYNLMKNVKTWTAQLNESTEIDGDSGEQHSNDGISDAEATALLAKVELSPNCKDIEVKISELSAIPDSLARLRFAPHKGHGHIWKRTRRENARKRRLEANLRYKTSSYLNTDDDDSDVETFETVWRDAVDWEGTRSYCLYLKDKPFLEKPQFLVDMGVFEDEETYVQKMRKWRSKRLWAKVDAEAAHGV